MALSGDHGNGCQSQAIGLRETNDLEQPEAHAAVVGISWGAGQMTPDHSPQLDSLTESLRYLAWQ